MAWESLTLDMEIINDTEKINPQKRTKNTRRGKERKGGGEMSKLTHLTRIAVRHSPSITFELKYLDKY